MNQTEIYVPNMIEKSVIFRNSNENYVLVIIASFT